VVLLCWGRIAKVVVREDREGPASQWFGRVCVWSFGFDHVCWARLYLGVSDVAMSICVCFIVVLA